MLVNRRSTSAPTASRSGLAGWLKDKPSRRQVAVGFTPLQFPSHSGVDLTLVVPFYNPGPRFIEHVENLIKVLDASGCSYEILAVSDGSPDDSASKLTNLPVRCIELSENQGKGAALRAGFAEGRGAYIGFIDADGDIPASILEGYVDEFRSQAPDVLFGSKRHPASQVHYPPIRRIYSICYQLLIRTLFHLPTRDTQTGIKILRREVIEAVLPKMLEKRFAFDLELMVVAQHLGFRRFVELPVLINERFSSTISISSVADMIRDTLAIAYRLHIRHHYGPRLGPRPSRLALGTNARRRAQQRSTDRAYELAESPVVTSRELREAADRIAATAFGRAVPDPAEVAVAE
jgi:glycosyltransferase involved in cell wall biosynthesis